MREGIITDIFFLQDNGTLLKYDFTKENESRRREDRKMFDIGLQDNWKMITRTVEQTTRSLICYEHSKAIMRIYDLY